MKKNYYKLFIVVIASFLIVPQMALAAWWNPFTWKMFQKKEPILQVQVETETSEEKINELQKQLDDLKNQQPATATPVMKQETKKEVPITNNSAVIQAQIKAQVEAELKSKLDQEALIAKQKAEEEQARLDILRLEVERQAAEQKAIQDAAKAKQQKLSEINKKIADLNAKYLKDIENCTESLKGRGATKAEGYACENPIKVKYERDYNTLKVEFQQAQYGN